MSEPLTTQEREELISAHRSAAIRKAAAGRIEDADYHESRMRQLQVASSNPLAALTPAQLAAIRSVVLEVIDDGCTCTKHNTKRHSWWLDAKDESYANDQRLDFCDEIQRRIVARGAPATVRTK